MSVDLFACAPVSDFKAGLAWYERLFGGPPAFLPNDVEAVWELAEHRFVYIEHLPEHAGHSQLTLFVSDFDERLAAMAERGMAPDSRETYENGVRKAIFRDPDGNEIGFGGDPAE
ncbi:VOC family protein [Stackebrandtia albiflava]|uniref:VOC family protein n=1 Tax=Stackebrandtia albiflava TaxID=406432 RepID=UPI0011BF3963